MALVFTCDECEKPAAFEIVRTTFVRDFSDGDADALTETSHACTDHLQRAGDIAARFTVDGKKKRA